MTKYVENEKAAWKDIQNKQRLSETIWIIVMIVVLVFGIIIEIYDIKDCKKFALLNYQVLNYDNISLALLQIQATIDTLAIALLALLSGKITDSYMGISWNDFQLNQKPMIFKQKRIVYGLLILLVVSIGMHMLEFYNIVTAMFIVACIIIGISVWQIYGAFTEDIKIRKEIKIYYLYLIENKEESLLPVFVNSWAHQIVDQQLQEYKEWLEIFVKIFQKEFLRDTPEARVILQEKCSKLVGILFEAYGQSSKARGMSLLYTCYEQAFVCIKNHKTQIKEFEDGYHLFGNVSPKLRKCLEEVSIKIVEDKLNWNNLIDYIMYVNYELAYRDDLQNERIELIYFMNYMSYYLSQNKSQNYNKHEWGKILLNLKYYEETSYTIDKDIVNEQRAKMMLAYAIGLVRFQMFDLLKDTLYMKAMRHANTMNSKYYIYMVLSVHCYMFYIAEYESEEYVSKELKESCKRFLEDREIRRRFSKFLDWVDFFDGKSEENDFFNKKVEAYLKESLRSYEIWSRYDNGKQLLLGNVVRDYTTFLLVYMEDEYANSELMEKTIPEENIIEYYLEYIGKAEKKELLRRLLKYLDVPEEKRNMEAKVLFQKLERFIVQKFKSIEIEKAKLKQKEYMDTVDEENTENIIINKLKTYFKKEFADVITDTRNQETDAEIKMLFRNNILTDTNIERCIDGLYNDISCMIIQNLIKFLEEKEMIEEKSRDLMSDDQYIDYLKQYNPEILIGSEYAYEPQKYVNRKLTDEYLLDKKYIFVGFTNE